MATGNTEGTQIQIQGRLVWATGNNLFKGEHKKDKNTKTALFNQDGSPKISYGFGLAVPKDSMQGPNGDWFNKVMPTEAGKLFPHGTPANFAWKIKDGDGLDHEGKPFGDRDGYKGCWVIACTTTWPIKFFRFDQALGKNVQIEDGIQPGDYVNAQVSIVAHPSTNNGAPGLYVNPLAVQLVGHGKPIVSTAVNADSIFGTSQPALPPGASSMPQSPTGQQPLVHSGMPQPGFTPGAPAPMQPAPHHAVLPAQWQQPTQSAMPQPGFTPGGQPGPAAPPMPGQVQQQYAQPMQPGMPMPGQMR